MLNASEIPFRGKELDVLETKRVFRNPSEGHFVLELPDLLVSFSAANCRREFGCLRADVTVRTTLAGAKTIDGVLSSEAMDLSRRGDRSRLATFLRQRSGAAMDWLGAVELLCVKVLEADREGEPIVRLTDVALPTGKANFWEGLPCVPPLLRDLPTIWYGQGGEGKSLLALYAAGHLAKKGFPVLYADWELDAPEHRIRLHQLFGDDAPTLVHHVRCQRSLQAEAPRLSQWIHERSCRYIICDSVAQGVQGAPENADAASAYFRALRSLRIGSLLIAHTTKGTPLQGQEQEEKVFGSVFWTNLARSVWLVKKASQGDGPMAEIALYHKKSNIGPRLDERAIRMTFESTAETWPQIRIEPMEAMDNAELAERIPLWRRIKMAVTPTPKSLDQLAEELGASVETIRVTAHRKTRTFQRTGDLVALRGDDVGEF